MTGLLTTSIHEAEVQWASELMGLGPNGFAPTDGDASRLQAMLNLETCDYEACPGSGKTTLLVAKLAILAMRWPHRQQGICVLSHTNAARNEIGDRISASSAAGAALMRYPHFIGTIHAFVNEYLAIPWLRSMGYPIRAIDTSIALARRRRILAWKWRNAMEMRGLTDYALMYDASDFSGGSKGALAPHTDLYQAMVAASRQGSEEGYFCFDEMFVWANELLDRRPEVAAALRRRFPLVFIDEAQDNSEEQAAILHRIFVAGGSPSVRQRFGDSNQAIYAHNGQPGARTDPFPSGPVRNIPRSYRFPQAIADFVKGLGVVPQALVGAGPASGRVRSKPKQSVIFLFDDHSVQEVLPLYGAHLIASFDENELAVGRFTAVAGVHELDAQTQIPRAMGHYAPHYDPACARRESTPSFFGQYLSKARFEMGGAPNTHFLVNALASALLRLSELAGTPHAARSRKSPHRCLLEAVEGSAAHASYLDLVDKTLAVKGDFSNAAWTGQALPLVAAIASHLSGMAQLNEDARAFLDWRDSLPQQDEASDRAHRADNLFSFPADEPKVHVRLSSIHSVKGETHTATLVLDTYFHKHHLSELKPWLLGIRSGGLKQKKKGNPELEGVRLLGRLKLHYVAMTRPSHLLCVAMRRDAFDGNEIEVLERRGWQLVDCGGRPSAIPDSGFRLVDASR